MRRLITAAYAGASMLALATPAFAQSGASNDADDGEIVVTGTLIRGTEVTGSQTISVDSTAISAKAAGSTNELLSLIPQVSNTFNGRFEGDPRGIGAGISINRPNLRNLPSFNAASGGVTLVLVDGFRMTPVGVNQAAIDVDVIPSSVLAGIDAVTDGGASLYGADAVGGVLNFRTMRKYEGVKLDANFGFGTTIKGYNQWDGTITAGKSWATGNAYISAGYSSRDMIRNFETTWADGLIYDAAGNSRAINTECINPVGSQVKWFKFGPSDTNWTNNPAAPGAGVFPVGTACDTAVQATYLPKQTRWNVFASVTQELSDTFDLRVTGYWVKRRTELLSYPRGFTTPAQPGPSPLAAPVGTLVTTLGGTGFSFGANSAYVNTPARLGIETWGITPELTAKLGSDWQVRTTMHYGRSTNFQTFPAVNTLRTQCYVNTAPSAACTALGITSAGQLNPLNAAAANASVITDVTDFENAQQTKHEMFIARVIADGPIFTLPGGEAKLAVGAEYQHNKASSRLNADRVGALQNLPFMEFSRNSKSIFAEVSLPLVEPLELSASVRYDSYSDFGSTTNPNLGFTLRPFDGLKLFGHWNTSFNAPTAIDGLGISTGRFACGIYTPTAGPRDPLGRWNGQGDCALIAEGATAGVKPQTATSWAVGFEVTPYSNLKIGGEFYKIDFENILGAVNPTIDSTYITNQDLYIHSPSAATYSAFLGQLTNGSTLLAQVPSTRVALIVDRRTTNFSSAKLSGIDFHANYGLDTSWGRFDFAVNGNVQTKATQTTSGTTTNLLGLGGPKFTMMNTVSWNKNGVSARVTVNYSGKFQDGGADYLGRAAILDPFVQTNLFLGYEFGEDSGALAGTRLRLNIDNLFEAKPTYIRRSTGNVLSYANWTLGRVIKFGITKEF
ncbi:MAG: TonB-dependent receptor plug domain-containing protein [Novosphingobium sp.]